MKTPKVLDVLKVPMILVLVFAFLLAGCKSTPAETEVVAEEPAAVAEEPAAEEPSAEEVEEVAEEPAAEADPRYGGVIRYALMSDPQGWFPHNTESCQNMTVFAQIYSSLLRYDKDSNLVGDLAESWEWLDDITVVFHLREGVKWHNGDDFTADQVVKSMEHLLNPEVSLRANNLLTTIDHFEVVDPLTVKLVLKQPDVAILRSLATAPGQAFILHPDYSEETAGQSPETTVGTGPFMYESYEPGVSVKLVKNPNYFIEGMPFLDGIDYVVIPDAEARRTALLAGDVDVIESVDFNSLASLKADPSTDVPAGFGFYGCRLVFEPSAYPTDDVNVRQALNYAVDRQMIVDAVLAGEAVPIWGGMIPEGRFGYNPDLANTYSYDPEKAKAMLAESGWTDSDGDGWLDKDGAQMLIVFATYGPDWWSQVGEVVQANFKDIGVNVELQIDEWAVYKEKRAANKELPVGEPGLFNLIGSTIWGLDLVDMMQYYVTGASYNFGRVSIPELDALYLKARATTDDAEREELLRQAQAIEVEQALSITPAWINRAEAIRSSVKNFNHLNDDGCWGLLLWEAYLEK